MEWGNLFIYYIKNLFCFFFSEKVPDFIALFARMIGSLIYALILGWKLTLVYLAISPLVILTFNLTLKVIE
jgi:hypothetical protein